MHRYYLTTLGYGFLRQMVLDQSPLITERTLNSVASGILGPFTAPYALYSDLTNFERYLRGMPLEQHFQLNSFR